MLVVGCVVTLFSLLTYRGLVTNGSLGFSTKKVDFPASLVKSGGVSNTPCNLARSHAKKPLSLTRSFGNSTKKGRMQLKTSVKR